MSNQHDPLCNGKITEMAREGYTQFRPKLQAQMTDLYNQLFALTQIAHCLDRIYAGPPETDLKADMDRIAQIGPDGAERPTDLVAILRKAENPLLKAVKKEDAS